MAKLKIPYLDNFGKMIVCKNFLWAMKYNDHNSHDFVFALQKHCQCEFESSSSRMLGSRPRSKRLRNPGYVRCWRLKMTEMSTRRENTACGLCMGARQ